MLRQTENINVAGLAPLLAPRALKAEQPMSELANKTVVAGREAVRAILDGRDRRLLVVVGPCSIHDETAALDYATRLAALRRELAGDLEILMRVYFEKPRTVVGWKGLINDPRLDGSFDIEEGLRRARRLLLRINEMGLPAASEMLDPISPQYIADLIAWASIGARTTESQIHRELTSGLSMPIGYKNATDGNIQIAIDAMDAARHAHCFLGIDQDGRTCVVHTRGNSHGHLILRGGRTGPNFAREDVERALTALRGRKLNPAVMIDASHGNSGKDPRRQPQVLRSLLEQRSEGRLELVGAMIESNLGEGAQSLGSDPAALKYGVSITDACLGWEATEDILREAAAQAAAAPAPELTS